MLIKTSFQGSPLCCFIHTHCIISNSNATFAFPTGGKSQLSSPKIWEKRHLPGPGSFPHERSVVERAWIRGCVSFSQYIPSGFAYFYKFISYPRANGSGRRSGRKPEARVLIPPGYLHPGKRKH